MHKTDGAHNVAGEFVDEVIGTSPGTVVEEGWLNTMQRELVNIVEEADIALDSGNDAQVLAALGVMFRGFMNLTFSTLATTKPNLSGRVEVNGTWVPLDDVTPTGTPASPSSNWIYVSDAGSVSFDTVNNPSWDTTKRGYYYGDLRAVAWVRVDSGGLYACHHFLPTDQRKEIVVEETVDIGDWDMDATSNVSVTLPGTLDPTTIRDMSVVIRDDLGNPYPAPQAGTGWGTPVLQIGFGYVSGGAIPLNRLAGGIFDANSHDSTSYNRGWITIKHKIL